MAADDPPGSLKFVSLIDDSSPTGVDKIEDGQKLRPQTIFLNGPVTAWVVRKKLKGDNDFQFSLRKYKYIGVEDNKVTATTDKGKDLVWRAIYRESQDAFTIERNDLPGKAWTVADKSPNSQVVIEDLQATDSDPPQFLPRQLFRVVRNKP